MKELKVAAIQIGLTPSSEKTLEKTVEKLVSEAARKGARILCFPEHWLEEENPNSVLNAMERMKELALKFNVTIIAGGFYEDLEDGTYVTAPVIDPQGRLVGRQKKVHLFGSERTRAKPGLEYVLFDIDQARFGVMVCYDTVFPEVARTFALKGAEVVFVPSRILNAGTEPWHLYLSTRCLENRLPLVASNTVSSRRYSGRSVILVPKQDSDSKIVYSKALATGGESQEVLVANLDLETARNLRESRLAERRPSTYRLLQTPHSQLA